MLVSGECRTNDEATWPGGSRTGGLRYLLSSFQDSSRGSDVGLTAMLTHRQSNTIQTTAVPVSQLNESERRLLHTVAANIRTCGCQAHIFQGQVVLESV